VGAYRVLMKPDDAGKVIGEKGFLGRFLRMINTHKRILKASFIPQKSVRKAYLAIVRTRAILVTITFALGVIALFLINFKNIGLTVLYLRAALQIILEYLIPPAILVVILIHWTYERSKQQHRDREAMLYLSNPDKPHALRPHSLFLRAFYISNFFRRLQVRNSAYSGWPWPNIDDIIGKNIDLETLIACIAESHSFLIGIGRSSSSAVSGKATVSDHEWKRVFWTLAESAEFIVHVVANRPGTKWEFHQIIGHQPLASKALFIVPGSIRGMRSIGLSGRIQKDYSQIRSELQVTGFGIPAYHRHGFVFTYSTGLEAFLCYPSGNFTFSYMSDLVNYFNSSTAIKGCVDNKDFLRMLGPIRSDGGYYIARLINWDEKKKKQSQFLKRPFEHGSCFVAKIEANTFDLNKCNVIANPRIFFDPKVASMMKLDDEFLNMRDTIILKANGYQAALWKLSSSSSYHGYDYLRDYLREKELLKEKFFGIGDKRIEKIDEFIKTNRKFLNTREIYLWKDYIKCRCKCS
jgi:hypothetical protein